MLMICYLQYQCAENLCMRKGKIGISLHREMIKALRLTHTQKGEEKKSLGLSSSKSKMAEIIFKIQMLRKGFAEHISRRKINS